MKAFKQKGFTLTEIMVAAVVAIIVFTGLINILIASDETVDDTVNRGELQETGRLAMQIISRDIMMAGYWGSFTGSSFAPTHVAGSAANFTLHREANGSNVTGVINTQECSTSDARRTNNGTFPNQVVASSFRFFRHITGYSNTADVNILNGCLATRVLNSDVIQIKRLITYDNTVDDVVNGLASLNDTRFYMLTKPGEAIVFAGNDVVPTFNDGTHILGELGEYQHRIYFVREETRGDYTVPVLRRRFLFKNGTDVRSRGRLGDQALVEGVESLGFLYGLDTNGDGTVNYYAKASEITDQQWEENGAKVIAVRVSILVRTLKPNVNSAPQNAITYDLGSHTLTIQPNTNESVMFRRMLFTNTVTLLNRGESSWRS
ncbi:PilW family protein [Catenovulum sp. SM1970]|uniref:PilW family protein n=1 Tax=Marinifaba aquimaris TaxID=2741323 RepID=UPI0015735EB5|nr:PilW family protein [Marinifaba aquimaris]NTS76719.1 PilW family protein [Marinifaba aquimaris]